MVSISTLLTGAGVRACLLHADYHVWGIDCYHTASMWALNHTNSPRKFLSDLYEMAVEEKILLNTWKVRRH